ncbi:hypothetical protein DSO57_1002200 [Entomophthora muscae]|uniref:Uncharacterized protein n=2 Tax=Entomophthora muscae TaxID=34485 RepID=A0ACC2TEV7_9FUNG|nr:hypothetical protein DSO57_1018830 [Entomophthora muscae]KAJ9082683.1 hypothetical protein DSO57_1002200 [Entomophthora muscae]
MNRLPPVSELLTDAKHMQALWKCPKRSREDDFQLSRFKLDFTPSHSWPLASISRHRMSSYQTSLLELAFQTSRFPSRDAREFVASLLNISPRRVQVWFQNKRQKLRSTRS